MQNSPIRKHDSVIVFPANTVASVPYCQGTEELRQLHGCIIRWDHAVTVVPPTSPGVQSRTQQGVKASGVASHKPHRAFSEYAKPPFDAVEDVFKKTNSRMSSRVAASTKNNVASRYWPERRVRMERELSKSVKLAEGAASGFRHRSHPNFFDKLATWTRYGTTERQPIAGTPRRGLLGIPRGNRRGSLNKCFRREFNRYSRKPQQRPSQRALEYRAGTLAGFARATVRMRDTGRFLRTWLAFRRI